MDAMPPGKGPSKKIRARSKRSSQKRRFCTEDASRRSSPTMLQFPRELMLQLPRYLELQALTPELPVSSTSFRWSEVCAEVLLGDVPRCSEDVDAIAAAGAKALIIMVDGEDDAIFGCDWDGLSGRATALEVVTSKITMDRYAFLDQATCLPEAVKIVTALTEAGHTVYLCDSDPFQRASLVTLGYLTFARGMELKDATKYLLDVCPLADPSMAAWEETRSRLLSGQSARVAQLAKEMQFGQSASAPGVAAENWLMAQRMVASEQLKRGVSSQVRLAEALKQIGYLRGRRALEGKEDSGEALEEDALASKPIAPAPSQLLLALGAMEQPEGGVDAKEAASAQAAKAVRVRVLELAREVLAQGREGEREAAQEALGKLKARMDALLKHAAKQRLTSGGAQGGSDATTREMLSTAKQLEVARRSEGEVRAQSASQISALQKDLSGLHKELVGATGRILDLGRSIEEERAVAKEVASKQQECAAKVAEQVVASFRVKIEAEAAEHRLELELAEAQHMAELERAQKRHRKELERAEASCRPAVPALESSSKEEEAGLDLSGVFLQNESLVEQLEDAEECMARMAGELDYLQTRVLEDTLKREEQVEEELAMLRSAQARVERMAAEKVKLEQQILLQRAVLMSVGLAVLAPVTMLAAMAGGPSIPRVSASEVIGGPQLMQLDSAHKLRTVTPRDHNIDRSSLTENLAGLGGLNSKPAGGENSHLGQYAREAPHMESNL